ncbi:MAG: haloacid dehalogenase [Candidatus Tyloplasma litorale]|nr:MAG: haloacid dehalogenase [Mycoplasmatales bacterium]
MTFKLKKDTKYIFATDLDGTFLTSFVHSLHIDSYEMIEKIKENGHHFVIATGRSWWWTKTIYEQIGSIDASIHFSGAIVHHPRLDNFNEFRSSISQIIIKNMLKKIDVWSFATRTQAVGRKFHATWSKGDDVNKLFFNCYEYIIEYEKSKNSEPELLAKIAREMGEGYVYRVWNLFGESERKCIIISPKGTSKSEGLKKVAEYYEIPKENVVYFGDNINDLDALEWAGYSFAPSNALEVAKETADEVLKLSCEEGAVPKKIIELINEQNGQTKWKKFTHHKTNT